MSWWYPLLFLFLTKLFYTNVSLLTISCAQNDVVSAVQNDVVSAVQNDEMLYTPHYTKLSLFAKKHNENALGFFL
jgi:sulfur transfer complex TusBCD TusB component (DsrH family)